MTPEAQRIAIAKACPGVFSIWEGATSSLYYTPGSNVWILTDILNDLNAMHEAEKVLKHQKWPDYWNWLFVASTRQSGTGKAEYKVAHASAAQRAEAFLRTLGKWEESA